MLKENFPTIIASLAGFLGALLGVVANIYLGRLKAAHDTTELRTNSGDALRDDLFELIETQESKIQKLEAKNDKQQEIIDRLTESNNRLLQERTKLEIRVTELEADNTKLAKKIQELQEYVATFEKKVFYRGSS